MVIREKMKLEEVAFIRVNQRGFSGEVRMKLNYIRCIFYDTWHVIGLNTANKLLTLSLTCKSSGNLVSALKDLTNNLK